MKITENCKVQFVNPDDALLFTTVNETNPTGTVVKIYSEYFKERTTGNTDLLIVDFGGPLFKVPAKKVRVVVEKPKDPTVEILYDDLSDFVAHYTADDMPGDKVDVKQIVLKCIIHARVCKTLFGNYEKRKKSVSITRGQLQVVIDDSLHPGDNVLSSEEHAIIEKTCRPIWDAVIEHYFPGE